MILWDFDGVLIDSDKIRENGFRTVLENYPHEQVDKLIQFHRQNGGLSRYVKFRYFFEKIRGEQITEKEVFKYAEEFSSLMKLALVNPELLIKESIEFVKDNYRLFEMHIVSGSDQNELRGLCDVLGISSFFKTINGSPTPIIELVRSLVENTKFTLNEIVLIGDSVNDYDAARLNGIKFKSFNNDLLFMYDSTF
jgi:phosphoglycolate phosphatase-like HAD superfamily hydrolase